MKIGDTVKLTNPADNGEAAARFTLVQDNGDRVMIRLICSLPIPPVETVRTADIALANEPTNPCTKKD